MMYNNQMQNQEILSELINIISLIIGMENLKENREQSYHNDVQKANDNQAKYLLEEINKQFEIQNQILHEQNLMLGRIISYLEENNYITNIPNTFLKDGEKIVWTSTS